MEQQQATTPTDVAQPTIDDRIAAKFGLDQPETKEEAPEVPQKATPEDAETEELDVEAEEEEEEETPPADELEVLTHKGEEKRVSKEEMRNLAQKGFDYEFNMVQNKTERQRLAGIATALEAQQALNVQLVEHVAEVKAIDKQLAPFQGVDWIKFSNDDPIVAFQARQVFDQLIHQRNGALSAFQYAAQQQGEAQGHVTQEQLAHEHTELLKRVPEWKDAAKATAEKRGILEDLSKNFNADELKNWSKFLVDHRIVGILRDGYKYRQAVEAGKAKKGQLQGLPQPARPGARQNAPTAQQNVAAAKTDLRKARSPETRRAAEDRMIAAKFGIKL